MNSEGEKIKPFRFVKRKLSVHDSIINIISPKKTRKKDDKSLTQNPSPRRRRSLKEQENSVQKIKEIYIKNKKGFVYNKKYDLDNYVEPELDYSSVVKYLLGSYNEDFQKIVMILTSAYSERKQEEIDFIYNFLMKYKINEALKTDMLLTELPIDELYKYFKPYIFGKYYKFMDTIYYKGEEADNLYIVLHGSLGKYKLEVYEEELTCEEYFIFLSDCYNLYEEENEMGYILTEEQEPKKGYKINLKSILKKDDLNKNKEDEQNIENKKDKDKKIYEDEDEDYDDEDNKEQYIDHYLICQMIDENSDIYPLREIGDLVRLKKIIFKLRLYTLLSDLNYREAELLFRLYEFPTTYLNFDRVIDGNYPLSKYLEILSLNFKQFDYFYMKLLEPLKHKVKLMKYVKYSKNLEPNSYFGNFELINTRAKREFTVRCESENCILLCIDKRMYSLAVYNAQKKKRDKELELMHDFYLFRNVSKKYFNRKIYSNFQINNKFKNDLLFKQNKKMKHFILIKEGKVELSLQNLSYVEFHRLIKLTKEILIKKGKELKINMKEFFDFNTEVESKTFYNITTLKGILNQKQNFIFQRNEKGIFGDYELFFDIPALLTGKVISERCILYYYEYDKYKSLSEETYLLNDSLRYNSFVKLKSLLKRMIMVYNSYWRLSMEHLEKSLKEKDKILGIINDEEKEQSKISVFNSSNLRNNSLLDNINIHKSLDKYINPLNSRSSNGRYNYLFSKGKESKLNYMNSLYSLYENNNNIFLKMKSYDKNNSKNFIDNNISNIIENNNKSKLNNNNIKTIKNKIFTSPDNFKKNPISIRKAIKNDFGKEEYIDYKTINEDLYQKKLIKDFKQTINAQRMLNKKEKKKIFLPPLGFSFQKFYDPILRTEIFLNKKNDTIIKKTDSFKSKKNSDISKSSIKEDSKNLNDSLNLNNSYSMDNNKSKNDDSEKNDFHENLKKVREGLILNYQKKVNRKSQIKQKFNFKLAQLYNIQIRKDKKNNSFENSFISEEKK